MEKQDKISFGLFVTAQVMTITFITLLQITSMTLFIPFLLLMHVGIVLFIISKKRLLQQHNHIERFYKRVYLLLALYLPILIYKLPARVLPYDANYTLIKYVTISVTIFVASVCAVNTVFLYRTIRASFLRRT